LQDIKRATEVMHGAAVGYVLSQIRVTPEERDPKLSEIVRESALGAIANVGPQRPTRSDLPGRAVALREVLLADANGALTPTENR
jgi:hypothetical protein